LLRYKTKEDMCLKIKSSNSGMIRTTTLQSLNLTERRFGFEPELTAKLSRIPKIKIYEVGVSYYGRTYEDGKKIEWKDGVRAIYCIVKYGLFRAK